MSARTFEGRCDALRACGSPAEVAELLREAGAKGCRGMEGICPLAKYLEGADDVEDGRANPVHLIADARAGVRRWTRTPAPVADFIRAFDRGDYEELQL